jgi:hypothetical protein
MSSLFVENDPDCGQWQNRTSPRFQRMMGNFEAADLSQMIEVHVLYVCGACSLCFQ